MLKSSIHAHVLRELANNLRDVEINYCHDNPYRFWLPLTEIRFRFTGLFWDAVSHKVSAPDREKRLFVYRYNPDFEDVEPYLLFRKKVYKMHLSLKEHFHTLTAGEDLIFIEGDLDSQPRLLGTYTHKEVQFSAIDIKLSLSGGNLELEKVEHINTQEPTRAPMSLAKFRAYQDPRNLKDSPFRVY